MATKRKKSAMWYPIVLFGSTLLIVTVYLTHDLIKPVRPSCESMFEQTSIQLDRRLGFIQARGGVHIGRKKIQDLSERAAATALNLKTCCTLLDAGEVDPKQFLACKGTVQRYAANLDTVMARLREAETADGVGKNEIVDEKVREINLILEAAKGLSESFSEHVTRLTKRDEPHLIGFAAEPAEIAPGESATLRWRTDNAERVTLNGELVELSGTRAVSPRQTTKYELVIPDQGKGGLSHTRTVTVEVREPRKSPPQVPAILVFSAAPGKISEGEEAILRWETFNAEAVAINNVGNELPRDGKEPVRPTRTTLYTLLARNESGQAVERDVTVEVISLPRFDRAEVRQQATKDGCASDLIWETSNTEEVAINGIGAGFPPDGVKRVAPVGSRSYTLLARNSLGRTVERSVMVASLPPPRFEHVDVRPRKVKHGGGTELIWQTSYADEVTIRGVGEVFPPNGKKRVLPSNTMTYTLTARNACGQTDELSVPVEVIPPPRIDRFEAVGNELVWETSGADEVAIRGIGSALPRSGKKRVTPRKTTQYTLRAKNELGQTDEETIIVHVEE